MHFIIKFKIYIYIYLYIYIYIYINGGAHSGGARDVMVIVVENGHGETSSNRGPS